MVLLHCCSLVSCPDVNTFFVVRIELVINVNLKKLSFEHICVCIIFLIV